MLSTFLPFYLLPPVTKFRGVFGGRKLFLPGHFGLIFDGRVETCFYYEDSKSHKAKLFVSYDHKPMSFAEKSIKIGIISNCVLILL